MPATIIETSDNRRFRIRDAGPGLAHAWLGIEVKRTKAGYVPKASAREILVRKAGCRIIEGSYETLADFEAALMSTLPADAA